MTNNLHDVEELVGLVVFHPSSLRFCIKIFGRLLRQNLRWAYSTTLPETNSLPLKINNQWLEDEFHGQSGPIFRGELLVSGSVSRFFPDQGRSECFSFFCRRVFD